MNYGFIKNSWKLIFLTTFVMFFIGCGRYVNNSYDKGYAAGYKSIEPGAKLLKNNTYMQGYRDGELDSLYDEGYEDAYHNQKPVYPGVMPYMEGYEDGKK